MKEEREFKIHPHLLRDVIQRQAGTIEKACLEGVMNSIEAGASEVSVELDSHRVVIKDDGRGFQLREELDHFFDTFGTPHSEDEKKIWAEFRMGRGQMFAFGKNTWRTGTFRMSIDIRNMGEKLRYELESGLEDFPGCEISIELYTPLTDREIYHTDKEIGRFVHYVEIPVIVNGRVVSTPPTTSKWTTQNDDAFIRLSESGVLAVYNLGVLVCTFSQSKFGVAGVVVSKKRLMVNFARNDIISTCPVWGRIRKQIDQTGADRIKRKPILNDGEREALILRFLSGDADPNDYLRTKLFADITGTLWSVKGIIKQGFTTWSVAPSFNRIADLLIQQGTCLVFSESILDLFDIGESPSELFSMFRTGWRTPFSYVEFEEISKTINDEAVDLPAQKWTPSDLVWLQVLEALYDALLSRPLQEWYRENRGQLYYHERERTQPPGLERRRLKLGSSKSAAAWTDGSTYITVAREFLRSHPLFDQHTGRGKVRSIVRAAQVLAHECCHEGEDCLSALHGPEFDQAYRKLDEALADAINKGILLVTPKWRDDAMKRAKEQWKRNQRPGTKIEDAPAFDADLELAAMTNRQETTNERLSDSLF